MNGTLENVKQDASANAILTADIIVNEGVLDEHKNLVSGKEFIPWTPIGNFYDGYTGTFDGKEHTISGLYFNKPNYNVGLFGWLGAKGKISNVGVLDSYFQFSTEGGGICGSNYGELQNCSNSSTVIGTGSSAKIGGVCGVNYGNGTVRDCKNTGSVRGNDYVGGVCGFNEKDGIIENSFNEGTVNGTDVYVNHVGGVCGESRGTIKSCYNTASVSGTGKYVGGVCGDNSDVTSTITNCFNEGTVSATGDYAEDVGGVSGYNNGTIKSCYNTASVSGQYCVGGVCGGNSCGPITNCFNKGIVVCGTQYSVGGVCGNNYEGPIKNCYYLSGTVADGKGGIGRQNDVPGKAEKMSLERFKSGEVAWLLNGSKSVPTEGSTLAWYQKLSGTDADAYPVLTAAEGNTVYHGSFRYCDGKTSSYSNSSSDSELIHVASATLTSPKFDADKHIYHMGCSNESCPEHKYAADADGTLEAKAEDGKFYVEKLALTDASTAINTQAQFVVKDLQYSRQLTEGQKGYVTLCLPFDINVADVTGAEKCYPVGDMMIHMPTADASVLKFVLMLDEQSVIKAGTPMIVKLAAEGTAQNLVAKAQNVEYSANFFAAPAAKSLTLRDWDGKSGMMPICHDLASAIIGGVYPATTLGTGSYSLREDGTFGIHEGELSPYRVYLNIQTSQSAPSRTMMFSIGMPDDSSTTGIRIINMADGMQTGSSVKSAAIYTLEGQRVKGTPRKGIYIKNGKKFIVK